MPASHPDTAPSDDAQVKGSASPKVEPNGGEASHLELPPGATADLQAGNTAEAAPPPEEPPEVEALLGMVRPWQLLLLLAVASLWFPATVAAFGKRVARSDRDAAEARWAAEDAARDAAIFADRSSGNRDSYAILQDWFGGWNPRPHRDPDEAKYRRDWSALLRLNGVHVAYSATEQTWVNVVDADDPTIVDRLWSHMPGTQAPSYMEGSGFYANTYSGFGAREFPSREASTYATGSVYFEQFQCQSDRMAILTKALTEDTWPPLLSTESYKLWMTDWEAANRLIAYRLHATSFSRDWAAFEQAVDFGFILRERFPRRGDREFMMTLRVVLEQHGAAMPASTLLALRAHLVDMSAEAVDVQAVVARWERVVSRTYYGQLLGPKYEDEPFWLGYQSPIFTQIYAMRHPFRRDRLPKTVPLLVDEITENLATPGVQGSRFPLDGGLLDGKMRASRPDGGNIYSYAKYKSVQVDQVDCERRLYAHLYLAGVDALLVRASTGVWPTSVAALGEPELRVDPFSPTGAPLLSRVDGTGAIRVWSVWRFAVDGGGLFSSEPGYFDADFILRIEPPLATGDMEAGGQP